LLVLTTFICSIAGLASAAQFSDVNGSAEQSAAIYKLEGLGIIGGYPDGTFKPEKTITRAEFAKIAVNIAGLKSTADTMVSNQSVFADVKVTDWFNGFVNVAAAQEFVKGDTNGNFRPHDQITHAEVITVLMRILGYNDNLPGDWPADYINQATTLGVLTGISFAANQASTRADVAMMGSKTLDQNVVTYQSNINAFNKALRNDPNDNSRQVTYTLIEAKFNTAPSTTPTTTTPTTTTPTTTTPTTTTPTTTNPPEEQPSTANASCSARFTASATVGNYTMGNVTIDLDGLDNAVTFTVTYSVAGTTKTTAPTSVKSPSKTITKNDSVTIKVYDKDNKLLKTFADVKL
jgi:hypothetical protein